MNIIKNLKKTNRTTWFLYAFFLSSLCYFLFLSYSQLAFGRFLFLQGDDFNIYAPVTVQLINSIINMDSPFFSWSSSFGMNTSALIASDGQLLGLTSILCFIFSKTDPAIPIFISMILRAGLSGMTFQLYSVKYLNKNKLLCLLVSLSYSMCAFQVSVLVTNQIWMDALWILPLIILFINNFLKNNNFIPLTICYSYIFIVNFYMGYMIGLFSFIYFLLALSSFSNFSYKSFFSKFTKYILSVLWAAGLSSFLLLPAGYFIITNPTPDASSLSSIKIQILDIANQLLLGTNNSADSFFPYIYSGLLSALMLPFFFLEKRIPLQKRRLVAILLLFLIASCLFSPLYLLWHAFDAPDGFAHRFAYIITFVICCASCYALRYLKFIEKRTLIIIFLFYETIYIFELFYQKKYPSIYQTNDLVFLAINTTLLIITIISLLTYKKYRLDATKSKSISAFLILLLSFELILNGYSEIYNNETTFPSNLSVNYTQWRESFPKVLAEIHNENDDIFYRIDSLGDYNSNSDMYWSYAGTSDFCSIENSNLRSTLRKMGIYTSPRLTLPFGYSDFTCMLLDVKYRVTHAPYNSFSYYLEHDNSFSINPNTLGLGFLVDPQTASFVFKSNNPYNNINDLSKCMSNTEYNLYTTISQDQISFIENGINIEEQDNGTFLVVDPNSDERKLLIVALDKDESIFAPYITFSYGDCSFYDYNSALVLGGAENIRESYGRLSASYIKPMDLTDNTFMTSIEMTDDTAYQMYLPDIYVANYDKKSFLEVFNKLQDHKLLVKSYHNGYVHGEIDVPENSSLLFTSIPNEEGWEVYVNGQKTDIVPLIDNTFIGVSLDAGDNDIEFIYHTPLAKEGFIISCISLFILLVLIYRNIRKKRNPNNKL